jgi:hypothetical protein
MLDPHSVGQVLWSGRFPGAGRCCPSQMIFSPFPVTPVMPSSLWLPNSSLAVDGGPGHPGGHTH